MARFGEHARTFTFRTDRFDTSSELPPDANAGNRFYGRDVAELVANGLGGSFFDEDWGWQVHTPLADDAFLEVSISYVPEDEGWSLLVRALRKERRLGITRFREFDVPQRELDALASVFREAGVSLTPDSTR